MDVQNVKAHKLKIKSKASCSSSSSSCPAHYYYYSSQRSHSSLLSRNTLTKPKHEQNKKQNTKQNTTRTNPRNFHTQIESEAFMADIFAGGTC